MRRRSLGVLAIATGLVLASPACGEVANPQTVASYQALAEQDLRLATIGYRLASANAPFCPVKSRQPGWVLHDIAQYPDKVASRAAFAFRAPVSVAALVPDGPADKAGIRAGDGLNGRNGVRWDWAVPKRGAKAWDRLEALKLELAGIAESANGFDLEMATAEGNKGVTLSPEPVCTSEFWVDPRAKLDAGADGQRVRITSAMVDFVADDDELAAVAAHEMAHNLLNHRARINAAKKGKTAVIRETEIEADRLSIWLMANADYDPASAIRFWQRYGPKIDAGIFSAPTHLRWKNRIAVFEEEIAKVAAAPVVEELHTPPLLAAMQAAR